MPSSFNILFQLTFTSTFEACSIFFIRRDEDTDSLVSPLSWLCSKVIPLSLFLTPICAHPYVTAASNCGFANTQRLSYHCPYWWSTMFSEKMKAYESVWKAHDKIVITNNCKLWSLGLWTVHMHLIK